MVWQVERLEFRSAALDFRSSGQGRPGVTQLLFDGELFANATGLTDWDADVFQVLVCEDCGVEDCEPGNWVQVRRLGTTSFFTPCWSDDVDRHSPPRLLERRGIPVLSDELYRTLGERLVALPGEPPDLGLPDVASLIAFEAPRGLVTRDSRTFRVHPELLVAVSEGETEEMACRLQELLDACLVAQATPVVRRVEAADAALTFYVNDTTFTEWTPLVRHGDGEIGLLLGSQSVLVEVPPSSTPQPKCRS
jgi:hypothetical protein